MFQGSGLAGPTPPPWVTSKFPEFQGFSAYARNVSLAEARCDLMLISPWSFVQGEPATVRSSCIQQDLRKDVRLHHVTNLL